MITPDYNKLALILEHFEGFFPNAYQDTGKVWTIGYGSTYNFDKKRKVMAEDTITKQDAIRYVRLETFEILNQIRRYIKVDLNDNQSAALMDYVYNRGIGNMLKTKLDELINANPNDPKIKDEIIGTGLWDRLGNKLWGLGRRRRAEAHLYFTGELKFDWAKWK
jgi:lysozyme